ncbi:MAG: dienelactone hydrolase family protein [Gammaproteobacteria bacterium]|nr:dienelactone hydrolase family protein [Pseudomonadales bacterium]MCP5348529.1 dienelactone hydrolase family protein [Pseudomonadales bacterium]
MIRKLLFGLLVLTLVLSIGAVAALFVTAPAPPPRDSESAAWLEPGPYRVGTKEMVFVDPSRPTAANGEFPGAQQRTFNTTLWYPQQATGNLPLIVHSHGLTMSRSDLEYVLRHLASYGYLVVAADFPLTNGSASGGPEPADLVNQPADVSFLIDAVLSLIGPEKPFPGVIDLNRIGLMGYSLGGATTILVTFHPRLRDTRVSAAVSIAGLAAPFLERFYQDVETPLLMIAGSADALVNYQANAAPIPERVPAGDLLTIFGGTHLGFAGLSEPYLRLVRQPDRLGCGPLLATLDGRKTGDIFLPLVSESDGIVASGEIPDVCEIMPTEPITHPGRQQMITRIAVLAFFESVFSSQPQRRLQARTELGAYLGEDFVEAVFTD